MLDTDLAQRLLSLFTSSDRAQAIAGDLTEERPGRTSIWFWGQVLSTISGLWRGAVASAPLSIVALVVAGFTLFVMPVFVGIAAVSIFPFLVGAPLSWIVLSFFWCVGALWAGASLASLAQTRGLAACVTLALAVEALLITFGIVVLSRDTVTVYTGVIYVIAIVATALIPAGGAVVRARTVKVR